MSYNLFRNRPCGSTLGVCCFALVTLMIVAGASVFPQVANAAPPAANLDQTRNGEASSPVDPGSWVNGNLGAQQSHYIEGYSVPYRAVLTNLPTGVPITITLEYDVKHSGAHALDYLTHYNRLEPHVVFGHDAEELDPLIGVSGVAALTTTFPIPAPSSAGSPVPNEPTNSFNALPASERLMTLFGGTISAMAYVAQGDLNASNSPTSITVTFTATNPTAVLAWGGHIGSRLDWGFDGDTPRSAGGISGSPYHMRLIDWTLNNLGNQDRSLSAAAVIPPPDCGVTGPGPVCADALSTYTATTDASSPTYSWALTNNTSGAFIDGSSTGSTVDVDAGGSGGAYTIEVTVTDTGTGLSSTCGQMVTVNPLPVMSCSPASYCVDAGSQSLLGLVSPPGGTFSGTGITGSNFDPSVAGVGPHQYTYTYTDGNGCSNSCNNTLTVTALPVMSCNPASYCVDAGVQSLLGLVSPAGGTFSGTGITGSNFDPSVAGVGPHQYTYTYTDGSKCTNSCSNTLTVNPLPVVVCNLPALTCGNADKFLLAPFATPSGGTWSGPGVTSGVFDPSVAGVGKHELTYTYTDGKKCTNACVDSIEVAAVPRVTFGTASFCEDAGVVDLSGFVSPPGGSFSGSACVTAAGMFDTGCAGTGQVVLTYSYTDANGCANNAPGTINVNPTPSCALTAPQPLPMCDTKGNTLDANASNGTPPYTYSWTVGGAGSYEGTQNNGATLVYTAGASEGYIEVGLRITDKLGCTDSCYVEFPCMVEVVCSFTQGFWGNGGGKFNGKPTYPDLIEEALSSGPIVVGMSPRSLTIPYASAACVVFRLPAGGTAAAMPDIGDAIFDEFTCQADGVTKLPINNNYRFDNVLLGQVIALSLNTRISMSLSGVDISHEICLAYALPGPDGDMGTGDDVAGAPAGSITISSVILTALDNEGLPQTVAGLLALGNRALANLSIGGATISQVNEAVSAINEGFDRCRFIVACGSVALTDKGIEALSKASAVPTEYGISQNYPNPFNPTTTIQIGIPEAAPWEMGIYTVTGKLVKRFSGATSSARFVGVQWDGRDNNGQPVTSGVYLYRVVSRDFTAVKKMVLLK